MRAAAALILLTTLAWPGVVAHAAGTDDQAYSAVIARPLFDPTRRANTPPRPPPAAAAAPAPALIAQQPLRATLVGIVTGGDRPIVLLRDSSGRVLRLTKGESIDGWQIVGIAARSIDVERNEVRQSLTLPGPAL